eukprot:scaffold11227_cov124-Isochrysis_galbana.AAC.1
MRHSSRLLSTHHSRSESEGTQERHQNRANMSRDHQFARRRLRDHLTQHFGGRAGFFCAELGPGDKSACAYSVVVARAQDAHFLVSSRLLDQACAGVLRSGQTGWAMRAHSGSILVTVASAQRPDSPRAGAAMLQSGVKKKVSPSPGPGP